MMSKLPHQRTSVVTILRNPIDRVFSTYEFSIEVAARFLVHPNLTSATRMARRLRLKTRGVSTLDIWPWKYLVPWMREDLFARVGLFQLHLADAYYQLFLISFFCLDANCRIFLGKGPQMVDDNYGTKSGNGSLVERTVSCGPRLIGVMTCFLIQCINLLKLHC